MSSKRPAISVQGLGKAYQIRRQQATHTTLADALWSRLRRPVQRAEYDTFWALRDVSFEIAQGEIVGIIGRNGAGKSTLLKILSRITRPTTGEVDLHGRVGSLLEVGTGFHQELTGRENIFLSGTILGMSRQEIRKQFDAIVDFAGVEQFLDTPVKRYSSGMYVRLAFAVAAHLEPEILIIDEVLAVGDAEFQAKCLGKMKDVSRGGRTVLFVSHHMHSINVLCQRVIVLDKGTVAFSGDVATGTEVYVKSVKSSTHRGESTADFNRLGTGEYRYTFVQMTKEMLNPGDPIEFRYQIKRMGAASRGGGEYLTMHLYNELGLEILHLDSRLANTVLPRAEQVEGTITIRTPWLKQGHYWVTTYICTPGGIVDRAERIASFEVGAILPYKFTTSLDYSSASVVLSDFGWTLDPTSNILP